MIKYFIIISLFFSSSAFAADPWSKGDIWREVAWQVLHVVDWGQTLNIADRPDKYHEINPIIGEHPSRERVNIVMGTTTVLHVAITHYLPKEWRPYWQYLSIGVSGALVIHNLSIGLNMHF